MICPRCGEPAPMAHYSWRECALAAITVKRDLIASLRDRERVMLDVLLDRERAQRARERDRRPPTIRVSC
jgi:heme exporter protein D